jgi:hypothetical protein
MYRQRNGFEPQVNIDAGLLDRQESELNLPENILMQAVGTSSRRVPFRHLEMKRADR